MALGLYISLVYVSNSLIDNLAHISIERLRPLEVSKIDLIFSAIDI